MTQSPFDSTGAQYAFDSTSLGWAETCLRLYQYYMIERWEPIRPSVHLWFGGHYATALEHFHKHLAAGMEREEALREIISEALYNTWTYKPEGTVNFVSSVGPQVFDHPAKTRENLIRSIIWYCDHFNPDPLETLILSDGRPAVEYSFTIELAPDILYCGHIDRLVKYGGDIYVQDQKTSGNKLTPHYFDQFDPDTQMSGYAFAARIAYKVPVKGVIIDGAQIAVGFTEFSRGFTFRTEAKLEEWRHDALYHIALARDATQKNYFPMNPKACGMYGGCAFRKVCSKSPEVREAFLKADFKKRDGWNPLTRR